MWHSAAQLLSRWIYRASSGPLITAFCGSDKLSGMMTTSPKSLLGKAWKHRAPVRLVHWTAVAGGRGGGPQLVKGTHPYAKRSGSQPPIPCVSSHAFSNRTALGRTVWRRQKEFGYKVPLPRGQETWRNAIKETPVKVSGAEPDKTCWNGWQLIEKSISSSRQAFITVKHL